MYYFVTRFVNFVLFCACLFLADGQRDEQDDRFHQTSGGRHPRERPRHPRVHIFIFFKNIFKTHMYFKKFKVYLCFLILCLLIFFWCIKKNSVFFKIGIAHVLKKKNLEFFFENSLFQSTQVSEPKVTCICQGAWFWIGNMVFSFYLSKYSSDA